MDYQKIIENIRARAIARGDKSAKDAEIGIRGSYGAKLTVTDDRCLWLVANTDDIDCDGEVVDPAGADVEHYFGANKQIFADHNYLVNSAVGTARKIIPGPTNRSIQHWKCYVHVYDKPGNKLGDDILTMAREGGIGSSIAFKRIEGGRPNAAEVLKYSKNGVAPDIVTRKWGWMELSFTAFPCNVRCQSFEAKSIAGDKCAGVIDDLLCKNRICRESAEAVGFRTRPVRKVVCYVR